MRGTVEVLGSRGGGSLKDRSPEMTSSGIPIGRPSKWTMRGERVDTVGIAT